MNYLQNALDKKKWILTDKGDFSIVERGYEKFKKLLNLSDW